MRIPNRLKHLDWQDYGISAGDVVRVTLRCDPEQIESSVVLTPIWSPAIFSRCRAESVADGIATVDRLTYGSLSFTMIRTGIGAPLAGDATIALGCTPCENLIFVGSVGGLDLKQRIGDLAIPTQSFSGDGFSAYLAESPNGPHWHPSQPIKPDQGLQTILVQESRIATKSNSMAVHIGPVFSSDTILAQFHHLDWITSQLRCVGIEMETSAVFKAARLCGIRAAALLQVSDVIPARKSLYSGRTEADQKRRRWARMEILAPAVLNALDRIGKTQSD
jgi:purine-nucleoside phosphorylase